MHYLVILIYFFLFNLPGHDYKKNNVLVDHPVLKIVSADSQIAAGYMKIENNGKKDIVLTKIISDIAEKQEIHEIILKNKVYKMRPLNKGLKIKSGEIVELKPKSYHMMFFGLNRSFNNDEMIKAKLVFLDDTEIDIEFKVIIGIDNDHIH